jgi:hypothetical protein
VDCITDMQTFTHKDIISCICTKLCAHRIYIYIYIYQCTNVYMHMHGHINKLFGAARVENQKHLTYIHTYTNTYTHEHIQKQHNADIPELEAGSDSEPADSEPAQWYDVSAKKKNTQTSNLKQQTEDVREQQSAASSDVTVVVRVRPLLLADHRARKDQLLKQGVALDGLTRDAEEQKAVHTSGSTVGLLVSGEEDTQVRWELSKNFTFDAVLDENSSTRQVFEYTGAQAVHEVVRRGINAVVFAYGQTGSGKTYTLLGERIAKDTRSPPTAKDHVSDSGVQGIASMTFQQLVHMLQQRAESEYGPENYVLQYNIHVSALEVYLDQVYDLLKESGQAMQLRTHLQCKTLSQPEREVCKLCPAETYRTCDNLADFEDLLDLVVSKRIQNATLMNDRSSRSHLILTLAVKRTHAQALSNKTHGKGSVKSQGTHISHGVGREYMSKLILVDLAGNERDSVRNGLANAGNLREEGKAVNASLCALSACLRECAKTSLHKAKRPPQQEAEDSSPVWGAQNKSHDGKQNSRPSKRGAGVYRTSALTRLLKESLSGAKIFFLACCSPTALSVATTRHTLRYARLVKFITTDAEESAILLEQGMNRFPITFIPHAKLVECKEIPRSDQAAKHGLVVYLHEMLRASVVRVMVSHRWLQGNHPDNANKEKHKLLCALFERLHAKRWIKNYDIMDVVNWVDYCEYSVCLCRYYV